MFLQLTLALVLVVLCGFLVALLIQLRRTATAVAGLADSARADLHLIASDIHHLRTRADELADQAAQVMALPVTVANILEGFLRSVEGFIGRGPSPVMDTVMLLVRMVMDWFLRRKPAAPPVEPVPM
jgi:hypothetical protein